MPDCLDRARLIAVLLNEVCAAAGEDAPPVSTPYRLGTSGVSVDLAVAAEEFIGFVIAGPRPTRARLAEQLATAARYCERVVLVIDDCQRAAAAKIELGGAALWVVDHAGRLHELAPGRANAVGPAALLDLMTPEHRARLLRPAVTVGVAYDRARPPLSPAQVRGHLAQGLERPAPRYWSASAL